MPKVTEAAREVVTKLSLDAAERHEAAAKLLSMHATTPLREGRVAAAYEALVDSARAEEALVWLRTFYKKKRNLDGLSDVYRALAVRSNDPIEGRSHALESIRLATDQSPEKSIERWQWFVERFGPDREAHGHLAQLLERAHRYAELAAVLEADALLAPPAEQAPILSRWGQTLLELGDVDAAIRAL